jgi:hypothetical protein
MNFLRLSIVNKEGLADVVKVALEIGYYYY